LPSNSGRNPKEQRNKASQRGLLRALQDARRMIGKKCSNSAVEQKGLAEGPGYGFTQHKNSLDAKGHSGTYVAHYPLCCTNW